MTQSEIASFKAELQPSHAHAHVDDERRRIGGIAVEMAILFAYPRRIKEIQDLGCQALDAANNDQIQSIRVALLRALEELESSSQEPSNR